MAAKENPQDKIKKPTIGERWAHRPKWLGGAGKDGGFKVYRLNADGSGTRINPDDVKKELKIDASDAAISEKSSAGSAIPVIDPANPPSPEDMDAAIKSAGIDMNDDSTVGGPAANSDHMDLLDMVDEELHGKKAKPKLAPKPKAKPQPAPKVLSRPEEITPETLLDALKTRVGGAAASNIESFIYDDTTNPPSYVMTTKKDFTVGDLGILTKNPDFREHKSGQKPAGQFRVKEGDDTRTFVFSARALENAVYAKPSHVEKAAEAGKAPGGASVA